MNEQLLLENARSVLIRLEETIIFAFIERAQFKENRTIYLAGMFGAELHGDSLVGYMLKQTERLHAQLRRYTSPDEHPFSANLPEPILPPLNYTENPLRPNTVNINGELRRCYEDEIIPAICAEGDDGQYGSSALCDVHCLQALSRRVHYGKFVAESKFRQAPDRFRAAIATGNRVALAAAITDESVETHVCSRVRAKADAYGRDIAGDRPGRYVDPDVVMQVYARWIIPLNKQVQVEYLLQRGPD